MYPTPDFYLAAFLKAMGYKMELSPKEGKVIFCIKDDENVKKLKLDYYNDEAKISPLKYKHAIKDLKAMLHSI